MNKLFNIYKEKNFTEKQYQFDILPTSETKNMNKNMIRLLFIYLTLNQQMHTEKRNDDKEHDERDSAACEQ